jgi:hypothetical protein
VGGVALMTEQRREIFDEWAIVEIMGRLKLAGRVSEASLFGTALCRVDVYVGDAELPTMTRMFGGSSIYCVTPCDEATARAFALGHQPEPVARWELAAPAPAVSRATQERFDDDFPEDQDDEDDEAPRDRYAVPI